MNKTDDPIQYIYHKALVVQVVIGILVIISSIIFSVASTKVKTEKDIGYLREKYTDIVSDVDKYEGDVVKYHEQEINHYMEMKDELSKVSGEMGKLSTKIDILLDRSQKNVPN